MRFFLSVVGVANRLRLTRGYLTLSCALPIAVCCLLGFASASPATDQPNEKARMAVIGRTLIAKDGIKSSWYRWLGNGYVRFMVPAGWTVSGGVSLADEYPVDFWHDNWEKGGIVWHLQNTFPNGKGVRFDFDIGLRPRSQ